MLQPLKPMKLAFFFLVLSALAAAQTPPPPAQPAKPAETQFARLDLLDGRTLKSVVVKSYDPKTERVLLLAEGKALLVPLALIPPPFNQQFSATLPVAGGSTSITATRSSSPPPKAGAPRGPAPRSPYLESSEEAEILVQHADAARARAERFFEYELQPGSGASTVTKMNVDVEMPEAVPGWTNRFRTKGKAYLSFYDSKGGSFRSMTAEFEVLTEQKYREPLKVIEFTRTK